MQFQQRIDPGFWTNYIDPESMTPQDLPVKPIPPNDQEGYLFTQAYTRELEAYRAARDTQPPQLAVMPLFALSCLQPRAREAFEYAKSTYT